MAESICHVTYVSHVRNVCPSTSKTLPTLHVICGSALACSAFTRPRLPLQMIMKQKTSWNSCEHTTSQPRSRMLLTIWLYVLTYIWPSLLIFTHIGPEHPTRTRAVLHHHMPESVHYGLVAIPSTHVQSLQLLNLFHLSQDGVNQFLRNYLWMVWRS